MNFSDFRKKIKGIFDGDAERDEFINNLENLWVMSKIEEIVEAEPNGWYYDREYQAMDEFELNRNEDGKIEIKYSGQVQNDQLNGFLEIVKQTGYPVRFTFRGNETVANPDDSLEAVKMRANFKPFWMDTNPIILKEIKSIEDWREYVDDLRSHGWTNPITTLKKAISYRENEFTTSKDQNHKNSDSLIFGQWAEKNGMDEILFGKQ